MSLRPERIWYGRTSERQLDLALIAINDLNLLRTRPLKPAKARAGEKVDLHGFPAIADEATAENEVQVNGARSTSNIAHRTHSVTALQQDYFVTEGPQPANAGFSGGPVINAQGEVVGMIIRSMGGQTRCIYIDTILDAVRHFDSEASKYWEQPNR